MAPNNALASHNGFEVERIILGMLGTKHTHDTIDTYVDGIPVEIKSCQRTIIDNGNTTGKRSGRFMFYRRQNEILKENGGLYALVVRDGNKILHTRLVPPSVIGEITSDICCRTWRTII